MKILFITANRVGDAVLTTGLLAHLERLYPDAAFTIACGPYGADVFRAVPRLQRLIVMRKKKFNGHWVDLWRQCVGTKWDLVVDLRNSIVSRLLLTKKLATHCRGSGKHKVVDNGAVLGLNPPPDPFIWIAPEAEAEAEKILPADVPILALGPAANWPLKQWPIESFISLAEKLTASNGALPNAAVMILADEHERDQVAPLLRAIPEQRRIDIIGRDLQIAAACLKRARLYVGNDSGLMHLAAALGVPTLGLFGPGFPHVYGPWGEKCAYVCTPESREELLASSQGKDSLMRSLSVESAVAAAEELLVPRERNTEHNKFTEPSCVSSQEVL
ncbi:MAG: glycosyltransferase family 9 protein [Alphaproteobacteria bacterium]|nr:glycosyltransferase family 9 protein [Alphaproteobacteria bacterium]